jgi:release factor glutamine methyltransferase
MSDAGMTLQLWLQHCATALEALAAVDPALDDVRLEARRLTADLLGCSVTTLLSRSTDLLTPAQSEILQQALARRLTGEPLAYITGRWWFWDIELEVAPCTLIPRPDTELLVEQTLALDLPDNARVLDLGTGTGAIALALAKAKPRWQLLGVDYSADAVALANRNKNSLQLSNCEFRQSDWYSAVGSELFDLIVSNPPYIDARDPHLSQGDVRFEPISALVAAEEGLADIRIICAGARGRLNANGWLWLEHGYQQAEAVQTILAAAGFSQVQSRRDYGNQWRITGGMLP